jgi:hypothetical protein
MHHPRRHVFHGNSSAVSARIRRPVDLCMPVQAACSLPVTGGLSEGKAGPTKFGERNPTGRTGLGGDPDTYISFDSASARAKGDYADLQKAVDMTHGKVGFDEIPTVTEVSAEVVNLVVIGRLKIGLASMAMYAHSPVVGEPSIPCEATLTGVEVDGYPVNITLDVPFFCECDTIDKLAAAAQAGRNPQCFFPASRSASLGFNSHTGMVKSTLVTAMAWAGEPHPEATIDGHTIIIPEFGKVYFAEMFVTRGARRLTMATFQLGSPDGGDGTAASGDTNGGTWPPAGG